MASKFLGKVGDDKNIFEIHALTNGHKFREIAESDISDPALYQQILRGRYQILSNGNAIYSTAVNPIKEEEIEYNPHDDREGTIHFVAVDNHGEIEAALAVAVDIGDTENGTHVGVPLENRWEKGDYPPGNNLDEFRKNYVRLNHNEDRAILPYEMAELYRHFKRFGSNNTYTRIGLYCGCYHMLVREARKTQKIATTLWVFGAIPQYFNLYRYAGAGVLRDFTIKEKPQFLSPSKKAITTQVKNNAKILSYEGTMISRDVIIPIPVRDNGTVTYEKRYVPFLDGIIDISKVEKAIQDDPHNLSSLHYKGFNDRDKLFLKSTLSLIGRRAFNDKKPELPKSKNGLAIVWKFNGIGM